MKAWVLAHALFMSFCLLAMRVSFGIVMFGRLDG